MTAAIRTPHRSLTVAALTLCVACGGSPPPAAVEPPKPEVHEVKLALKTRSELGTVEPDAVTRAFHALDDKFTGCQKQGLDRV